MTLVEHLCAPQHNRKARAIERAVQAKEKATGKEVRLSAEEQGTLYLGREAADFLHLSTSFLRKKCNMTKESRGRAPPRPPACRMPR